MDQLLEWPSKRIPHGGILHYPKVKYSQETQDLLKTLMNETKLTFQQQRQVDWCLRSGSSLADSKIRSKPLRAQSAPTGLKNPPKLSRRRSYLEIKSSGDFEREKFIPNQRNEDREVIKNRLQEIMEYGKDSEYEMKKPKINLDKKVQEQNNKLPGKYEILQDLLLQIKERSDWLEEMEALGDGSKHREMVQHQIAERMRKIDALKLPLDIMTLKIDDEYSVGDKTSIEKDLGLAESSRSKKTLTNRSDMESDRTQRNGNKVQRKNGKFKKCSENIADILYPL